MCGFTGIYSQLLQPDLALVKKMNSTLTHRGPDGNGYYSDNRIALGHSRLSIIDLSEAGKQPIMNENKDIIVAFNGEIYNHEELREWLINKGYNFIGRSDSEIIPNLYQELG